MLVTLARFLDPWEAYVVRALLEAEGLPATVAHAHHAIANWPMSLALGGTAVQVPAPLLVSARALLTDYRTGVLEQQLNEDLGIRSEHCPRCGSMDFKRTMPLHRRIGALVIVLFLAAYPSRRSLFICRNCGGQWRWGQE
ncbi:hypothetical protein [Oleiagrimonas soli]|uniref:DUF2007 domain-containing protein n=1 Tax=Oleiagrimonas soli TaxID=1543381 RepID=A0A099CZQ8_9GAMM|nr:hypothetical protein [Oleiagrimonas soli]KGI79181.1 hypothetical protein LF63_0100620 [Oleiagrimonas soli]MBB6184771.1 hypothetical protein [Oleiagrimonas soli]